MPEATNVQMQKFSDQRVRPFAEQWELLIARARSHKAAIDDIYSRAVGTNAWNDGRTDGPPHLMQSGNSQSPDDMLVFNSMISGLIQLVDDVDGNGDAANDAARLATYNQIRGQLANLSRAVVSVIGG